MRIGRLTLYMVAMIIGLGLFFGGIQMYAIENSRESLSDDEIIERARDLGMVDLKDALQE